MPILGRIMPRRFSTLHVWCSAPLLRRTYRNCRTRASWLVCRQLGSDAVLELLPGCRSRDNGEFRCCPIQDVSLKTDICDSRVIEILLSVPFHVDLFHYSDRSLVPAAANVTTSGIRNVWNAIHPQNTVS